jgi:hypothetical protein
MLSLAAVRDVNPIKNGTGDTPVPLGLGPA